MNFSRTVYLLVLALPLAVLSSAAAQTNLVGVYTDEEMTANSIAAQPGDQFTVFVVLSDPHNDNRGGRNGENVERVGCHSFKLDLATNLEIVADAAAEKRPICNGVCTDFRRCYGGLLPVGSDRRFSLESIVLRYLGDGPAEIRLRPHPLSAFDDAMDYWYRDADQTGWMLPMYPASGDFEAPVFVVNAGQVAADTQSWSTVKARYR